MSHYLDPWFYPVTIDGQDITPGIYPEFGKSDKDTEGLINRERCRRTLLVDDVKARYDFEGKRVLDVACNCAYWSSQYGAKQVVGVEGRELFLEQARLVNSDGLFLQGDVSTCDYEVLGSFDFILCAGILYHVLEPEELLAKLANVNSDVIVIDTRVGGNNQVFNEPRHLCFNAIDGASQKRVPVKQSLIAHMTTLGYEVEQLHPTFETIKGVDGGDDYNKQNRVCLFCKRVKHG